MKLDRPLWGTQLCNGYNAASDMGAWCLKSLPLVLQFVISVEKERMRCNNEKKTFRGHHKSNQGLSKQSRVLGKGNFRDRLTSK